MKRYRRERIALQLNYVFISCRPENEAFNKTKVHPVGGGVRRSLCCSCRKQLAS